MIKKSPNILHLSCKIFFVENGRVFEGTQTVSCPINGYSGYYGFYPSVERHSQISEAKLTRRRDIKQRFRLKQPKLTRRRSGSRY